MWQDEWQVRRDLVLNGRFCSLSGGVSWRFGRSVGRGLGFWLGCEGRVW